MRGIIPEVEQVKTGNCPVCGLPRKSTLDEYCAEDSTALAKVVGGYETWSKAYGVISRDEYLTRLSRLAETGERALQIAVFLAKNPDRWPG